MRKPLRSRRRSSSKFAEAKLQQAAYPIAEGLETRLLLCGGSYAMYFNDFQASGTGTTSGGITATLTGLSRAQTPLPSTTPYRYFGAASGTNASLEISGLGNKDVIIQINFAVYVIRLWGNDPFTVNYSYGEDPPVEELVDTTFSNKYDTQQVFPRIDGGSPGYQAYTGALERGTLGYTATWQEVGLGGGGCGGTNADSYYGISLGFVHEAENGSSVKLNFSGAFSSGSPDKTWGLDDIQVSAYVPKCCPCGSASEATASLSGRVLEHSMEYTNTPSMLATAQGGNWSPSLPALKQVSSGVIVQGSGASSSTIFDVSGSTGTARFGVKQTIRHAGSPDFEYVVTDESGAQTVYHDFSASSPDGIKGKLKRIVLPGGSQITTTYYNAGDTGGDKGLLKELRHTDGSSVESLLYEYGETIGKGYLSKVTLRRSTDSGSSWSPVRSAEYDYYNGTEANGSRGDLKYATLKDAAGLVIDTQYYRYYAAAEAGGFTGAMKFAFDPLAYERLKVYAQSLSQSVEDLTDGQVDDFADRAYAFDAATHHLTSVTSPGEGTVTFADDDSGNPDGYNSWKSKLVQTLPDGNQQITYENYATRPMLEVFRDLAAAVSITSFSTGGSGPTWTVDVTTSAAHGYLTNDVVVIDGASDGDFNGTHTITKLTDTTFRYTVTSNPGASATGGTAREVVAQWGRFHRYDSEGRRVMTAGPSALLLPLNLSEVEAHDDLLNRQTGGNYQYVNDSAGKIRLWDYYTNTTADDTIVGSADDHLHRSMLQRGENAKHSGAKSVTDLDYVGGVAIATSNGHGYEVGDRVVISGASPAEYNGSFIITAKTTDEFRYVPEAAPGVATASGTIVANRPVLLEKLEYIKRSDGATNPTIIYPLARETVYRNADWTGGQTTSYTYTWFTGKVQMESIKTTLPVVTADQNGPGKAAELFTFFDLFGRPTWTKDADGFINRFEYDTATWALSRSIIDVNTSLVTGEPATWATRSGGGLHLVTELGVDALGRTTLVQTPEGRKTYTVYNDAAHEVRVYPGWTGSKTTGPTVVTREDRANKYVEVLTMAATPDTSGSAPTGLELIADVQSLVRSHFNNAGQLTHSDRYFSFMSMSYPNAGTLNTNFYRTEIGYDTQGRRDRVLIPTGTITRTVYDELGRVASLWVGTDDTPTSGSWSPTNTAGTNLVKVREHEYDNGGVGESNLTKVTLLPGGGADNRVVTYHHDWRDRLVATKYGVQASESGSLTTQRQIAYSDLDNLSQLTAAYRYDGDNVSISDSNNDGVPDQPSASLLRAKSTYEYDEQGQLFRAKVFSVDPSTGSVSANSLRTNLWYDKRGNVIKESAPGGLVTKYAFDGAGRNTKMFIGDGSDTRAVTLAKSGTTATVTLTDHGYATGDVVTISGAAHAPYNGSFEITFINSSSFSYTMATEPAGPGSGTATAWADADDVLTDAVLEQQDFRYDKDGNVVSTAKRQRFHSENTAGPLGDATAAPKARVYNSEFAYDRAGRLIASVLLGGVSGTATSGSSNTLVDTSRKEATGTFVGYTLLVVGGVGSGQQKRVTAHNGSTDTLTVESSWGTAPTTGSRYVLLPPNMAGGFVTAAGSTILDDSSRTEADDYFNNYTMLITSGVGAGQKRTVTDFVSSTKQFTLDSAWTTTPDTTSTYALIAPDGLLNRYTYNAAGLVERQIDPKEIETWTFYDAASRPTKVVEGYVNDIPDHGDDRSTKYTYDGADHILTLTADVPGTDDQVTQYVYGDMAVGGITRSSNTATVTLAGHGLRTGDSVVIRGADQSAYNGTFTVVRIDDNTFTYGVSGSPASPATGTISARRPSDAYSNDVLSAVRYPAKSGGAASPAATDQVAYTHNALGEVKTKTDQNGSVHTYSYDVVGRLTKDAVTTLGTYPAPGGGGNVSVDGSVRRLEFSFNSAGLLEKLSSYSASSGGSLVNQVQRTYNGLGQLIREHQATGGVVNLNPEIGNSTPYVDYVYSEMSGGANHSRLTAMVYPSGRRLRFEYAAGLDDTISRLSFLADDTLGSVGTHLEEYSYLGLDTVVRRAHPQPDVHLTYDSGNDTLTGNAAADRYTGLDRFGRVVDQRWTTTAGSDKDRFKYGYDRNSNRLFKQNTLSSTHSELYHAGGVSAGYDKFNRLTAFKRGSLTDTDADGVHETVASPTRSQSYDLDALGNWTSSTTDGTSTSRTHNSQNQVTAVGANTLAFDSNGNTTKDETGKQFVYDAWNRLKVVKNSGGTPQETFGYDAAGRRVLVTTLAGAATEYFYSDQWQVLEDRLDGAVQAQYVWSPVYVDALVLRDRDVTADGSLVTSFDGDGKKIYHAGGNDIARDVAVDANGKIVVAGGDGSDFVIARFNSDGSLDTAFGSGGKKTINFGSTDEAFGLAIEDGGNIVVVGSSGSSLAVARLEADGDLDTLFSSDGKDTIASAAGHDVAIDSSDRIVVAGISGGDAFVARYTSGGALDTNFSGDGKQTVSGLDIARALAVQPDGKVVLAGEASSTFALARLDTSGTLDASFGTGGVVTTVLSDEGGPDGSGINDVLVTGDGKILAVGWGVFIGPGVTYVALARYNADGSLDSSFGGNGQTIYTDLMASTFGTTAAIQPDGRIVVAGYDDLGDAVVSRLTADGNLDVGFANDGIAITDFGETTDDYQGVALLPSGDIISVGTAIGGTADWALALYRGGGAEERLYALQDANFNVTALVNTSGAVVERFEYDPYGKVKVLNGAVGAEKDASVSEWSDDANNTSDWGWGHLHQGGRYDSVSGLYHFRNRDLSPSLGRWMSADPMNYVDGLSLYQGYIANPIRNLDPRGTDSTIFYKKGEPETGAGGTSIEYKFYAVTDKPEPERGISVATPEDFNDTFSVITTGKLKMSSTLYIETFTAWITCSEDEAAADEEAKRLKAALQEKWDRGPLSQETQLEKVLAQLPLDLLLRGRGGGGLSQQVFRAGRGRGGMKGGFTPRGSNLQNGNNSVNNTPRTLAEDVPKNSQQRYIPDAAAQGHSHSVLGTRTCPKDSPAPYRQNVTFDAKGAGRYRMDMTDHGTPRRAPGHVNPHHHIIKPDGTFGPATPGAPKLEHLQPDIPWFL